MLTNIKLYLNYLSIPGESLAARYNLYQGPVPGLGPAVEKHCSTQIVRTNNLNIFSAERGGQSLPEHVLTLRWTGSEVLSLVSPPS